MQRQLRDAFTVMMALVLLLTCAVAAQGEKGTGAAAPIGANLSGGLTSGAASAMDFAIYLPSVFKSFAAPRCARPTLISPANGSILATISVEYIWNDGDDPAGTRAHVEMARDAAFSDLAGSVWSSLRGEHRFRFDENERPGTTYYWRAYTECGEIKGPYSEVWSFTTGSGGTILPAPTLLAPANGSVLPGTSWTLQWSTVSSAVEYLLHWRKPGSGVLNYHYLGETQMVIPGLVPNTTYEWWVSARNDYAIGADSPKWTFTTGPATGSLSIPGLLPRQMAQHDSAILVVEEQGNE